jgi:hypothetical protein
MRRMTCVGGTWDENKRERRVEGFLFYNTSVALFLPIMSSSSLSEDIFRARNALCFGGVAFLACSASHPGNGLRAGVSLISPLLPSYVTVCDHASTTTVDWTQILTRSLRVWVLRPSNHLPHTSYDGRTEGRTYDVLLPHLPSPSDRHERTTLPVVSSSS